MGKKKQKRKLIRFGGGVLTDNISLADTGKINAHGIFTMFWAWDFPCHRRGVAIITLFDLPKRKTKVVVSVKKKGSKSIKLASLIVESKGEPPPPIPTIPLTFTLTSAGSYELVFSIYGGRSKLKIPFEVRKKDWPQFTKVERKFARTNPNCIKSIRTNVQCNKCSYSYVFEESLLETQPDKGIERFPDSGKYKCKGCKHTLTLRDLQGQIRSSLKDHIKKAMGKNL